MSIERDLLRRASAHAALADPARLRIVDVLTLGDASPSVLAAELGMTSNLLAHHLHVLTEAGIVVRRRSEADRRRSYVQLVGGGLDGVMPGSVAKAPRVLFVCTANSARSQLAAALWRRASAVPASSAGTHPAPAVAPGALAAARRHHLALRRVRPQHLAQVHSDGDLVITVCDHAYEEIGDLADLHWSVPDPVPRGDETAFDAAFEELSRRVDAVAPRLVSAAGTSGGGPA
jgi:protein-tyrosine-phosphatase/DNA-binding transcriptional ArsR family regulator